MKAAFTRSYNKAGHLSHYATTTSAKKRTHSVEEGEEEGAGSEEETESVDKNPMIKALKPNGKESGKGKGKLGGGRRPQGCQ